MKKMILALPALMLGAACSQGGGDDGEMSDETLESYSALGTEPFWNVELGGGKVTFKAMDGPEFDLPVDKMTRTETGWELRAFSGENNINMTITLGKECSDGMSDTTYPDSVEIAVGEFGRHQGCGGLEGDNAADGDGAEKATEG